MAKDEEKRTPDEEHARKKEESAADEEREDEKDDDDDDDDDADDADDDDEAEVEKAEVKVEPEAKAVAKAEPKAAAGRTTGGASGRKPRPRPVRAAPPPPPPAANLGARVIVFVVVLVALTSGFWLLSGFDSGLDKPVVKWRVGQQVELDITLVKGDANDLACSSSQDISDKKCEFSGKSEKTAGLTDVTMLKPYTTSDGTNFVAAGLWSQPALDKSKLPGDRFTIHCKYKVDGMLKTPLIRWNPGAAWGEKKEDWYAGTVSDCKLNPP